MWGICQYSSRKQVFIYSGRMSPAAAESATLPNLIKAVFVIVEV